MKQKILAPALWILLGMALMGIIVWFTMPSMMIIEHESPYDFETTISKLDKVIDEHETWKTIQVFDFQKNIHDAGKGPIDRVGTVAMCQPVYAARILGEGKNRKVTSMMPMGIGVYEGEDGKTYISELNVGLMGMMFGGTISEVMSDAGKDVNKLILESTIE